MSARDMTKAQFDAALAVSNSRGILGSSHELPQIPADMTEVTRDAFWAAVHATPLNVHPSPQRRHTDWMVVGTHQRWGWVSSGFAGPYEHEAIPERFALRPFNGSDKA